MKRFKDLPEHTQLKLSALLADVNYLKGFAVSGEAIDEERYIDACRGYENACRLAGVKPYDETTEPEESEEPKTAEIQPTTEAQTESKGEASE